MTLLLATFGFALASAVIPAFNTELYLGVAATQSDPAHALALAVSAALGATAGKIIWYVAAAWLTDSRLMRRKLEKPNWKAYYERWHDRLQARPLFASGVVLLSAIVGIPPLLVIAAVAGSLRMPLVWFVPAVFVGRAIRFYLILVGVEFALA